MMRRSLLAIAILMTPAAAVAADDTLAVRAGEHGDYSRLVIAKAPADWRIATSDRKIEITFPHKDYNFELADILDKRKAHRVLSARTVDADNSRSLVLTLTCDCPVRTSKGADNAIVIDIFNETPVTLSAEELEPERPISLEASNSGPQTPESMRAARDRMIALLAEARHQGVVQLKIDDEPGVDAAAMAPERQAAAPVIDAAHYPETIAAPQLPAPDPHSAPLAVHQDEEASPDAPVASTPPAVLTPSAQTPEANCVDPSLFYELEHDDGAMDYSSIANLRQKFDLSEDESERREFASTLALAYIHIGFFEEASAIAGAPSRNKDANMVFAGALADIASGSKPRAAHALGAYRHCGAFAELAYAAAARIDDDAVAPMKAAHLSALKPLAALLRAPLAENLGLNAVERGDMGIAKEFYDIAIGARGSERTPALAILETALAGQIAAVSALEDTDQSSAAPASAQQHAAPVITEELKEIAQNPGPLQAKALAILADDYEKRADAAYEGLLDDIAAQSGRKTSTLSEARASFTGAKALVTAGRLREGVAVLEAAARTAPAASDASRTLAQSFIMSGLTADDKTRLNAVTTFFYYRDFLDARDNGDLNIAVARELASYGASALVDDALEGAPADWRAQADAVRAVSHLNSGDAHSALDIVNRGQPSTDLTIVAVNAHERLNDRAGTVAVLKSAMRAGAASSEFTSAAWRAGDWALTNEAFAAVAKKDRDVNAASRAALAALNAGATALPPAVRETLARDPSTLAALAHMFAPAPAVNIRAIDLLSEFAKGVTKETDFMEAGLKSSGDAR